MEHQRAIAPVQSTSKPTTEEVGKTEGTVEMACWEKQGGVFHWFEDPYIFPRTETAATISLV